MSTSSRLNYSQLKGQVRVIVSEARMCRMALFPPQRVCSLTWVPQASSDESLELNDCFVYSMCPELAKRAFITSIHLSTAPGKVGHFGKYHVL